MNNVLQYLENSAKLYPDKIAAVDAFTRCTYEALYNDARKIGSLIAEKSVSKKPIVMFMDKGVFTLKAFLGAVYAGCFYTLLDPSFPKDRVCQILGVLNTKVVITTVADKDKLLDAGFDGEIIIKEDITDSNENIILDINEDKLLAIRRTMTDLDPLYCNFTSGSTGVPKGVLISHNSVIDFIDVFTETFGITNEDVIGNQAPFDFDVSVKDIYSAIKVGATLVMIPKAYFMFPNQVVEMLENEKVTTLIWAVSALCLLIRLHGLKHIVPKHINKIMFSGEMMPIKQFNQWKSYYPDAMYVNLYGPTEITCNCTYYIVNREFEEGMKIPMGNAFANERVFLLDDNDSEVTCDDVNKPAEICVSGRSVGLGYYNSKEDTDKSFVQNPLVSGYRDIIYRTGDLAYYGEDGLLYFAGRKDFQIKHMGHRIELEEIENVLSGVSIVEHACCFFDAKKNRVVAYYVGEDNKKEIIDEMKSRVPDYMVPNVFKCVERLPLNKNGKTDRKLIIEKYEKGEDIC